MLLLAGEQEDAVRSMPQHERSAWWRGVWDRDLSAIAHVMADHKVEDPRRARCAELLLTDACNLSCRYCYSAAYRSAQTMSPPTAKAVAKQLFANASMARSLFGASGTVRILFHGGGEPTVAWDTLSETAQYARDLSNRHEITLQLDLVTNGVIEACRLRQLVCHGFEFGVSLDGIGVVGDVTRQNALREGVAQTVMKTLDILEREGVRFSIRSVVTAESIRFMEEFAAESIRRWPHLHDHRYSMLEPTAASLEAGLKPPGIAEFQRGLRACVGKMIEAKVGAYRAYCGIEDFSLHQYTEACRLASMRMPVFNCNGDILRCNNVVMPTAKIGAVTEGVWGFLPSAFATVGRSTDEFRSGCEHCIAVRHCELSRTTCFVYGRPASVFCEEMQRHYAQVFAAAAADPVRYATGAKEAPPRTAAFFPQVRTWISPPKRRQSR